MPVLQQVIPLYLRAGLTTLEITMNSAGAKDMIRYAREHFPTELNVGAGTVCTIEDLDRALDAGAQFIVTPILNKQVIKTCVKEGVPVFPGAYTPTEIYKAWSLGAAMVKIFPATALGPSYIKDVKAPLPNIKLLPTGGVGLENIHLFRQAGADGYGIGSQLFDKTLIQEQNWKALSHHFESFHKAVSKVPPL
jgi:2-dehydro-3-deoxyphosphogluconate aldolase/(4S)-4-hydroxy-2-oxoglutarate aldolase